MWINDALLERGEKGQLADGVVRLFLIINFWIKQEILLAVAHHERVAALRDRVRPGFRLDRAEL